MVREGSGKAIHTPQLHHVRSDAQYWAHALVRSRPSLFPAAYAPRRVPKQIRTAKHNKKINLGIHCRKKLHDRTGVARDLAGGNSSCLSKCSSESFVGGTNC